MKTFLLTAAAALAFAVPAVAQDAAPAQSMDSGAQTTPPAAGADMALQPAPADMPAQPAPADTGAAPPADAGMNAPSGDMPAPTQPAANMTAAQPATSTTDYPMCSRTVKDKCINRGSKPRG